MPKTVPAAGTGRRAKAALAAVAIFLAAAPAPLRADHGELRELLAGLAVQDAPAPDSHAMRAAVTPHEVRLRVDRTAAHPLSGPVDVRRTDRLGAHGQRLRLVSLATPGPAPVPAPAVKNPSPPAASVAVPAPRQTATTAREDRVAAAPGRSILVAGDSLSLFLAEALRPMLGGRPGTAFASRGKVSSGLARPDFFDWEREMAALAAANRPDTVVVMIATNDNQTLTRPDGTKVVFGRPGWEAEYARRVRRLVELARRGNPDARIFWIGAPVMADARLNADVAAINGVIARQMAALPGCRFVDVSRTLADAAGRYAPALPAPGGARATRTKDGVHLTSYGAKLLAHAALASMSPTMAELRRP